MTTTISTVLNQLLASQFSDVTKQLQRPDPRNHVEIAAPDDSARARNQLASIAEQDQQDGQQQALEQRQQPPQPRQQSLKDFVRPQIAISPSDELQLFANPQAPLPAQVTQSSFVSDQTNAARRQVLNLNDRDNLNEVLQQRAQQAVSSLYARNNDIVYNAEPLINQAA